MSHQLWQVTSGQALTDSFCGQDCMFSQQPEQSCMYASPVWPTLSRTACYVGSQSSRVCIHRLCDQCCLGLHVMPVWPTLSRTACYVGSHSSPVCIHCLCDQHCPGLHVMLVARAALIYSWPVWLRLYTLHHVASNHFSLVWCVWLV